MAVAEESGGALAGEAAVGVDAVSVGVAVVVAGEAFVDVGARNAVACNSVRNHCNLGRGPAESVQRISPVGPRGISPRPGGK